MHSDQRNRSKVRAIWANKPGEALSDELVSIFPSPELTKQALSPTEINFLNTELSSFYASVLEGLSSCVSAELDIDREACSLILREPVVLACYLLCDRTMRLHNIVLRNDISEIGIVPQRSTKLPDNDAQLISLIDGSQEFNQYLLYRLASSIWELPEVGQAPSPLQEVRNKVPTGNFNFDQPVIATRLKRKIDRIVSARFGRIPALSLANVESPLLDHGLYGVGKLRWLDPSLPGHSSERDFLLRQRILTKILAMLPSMVVSKLFVQQFGMEAGSAQRASEIFCELLVEITPPDRLERIPRYLECKLKLRDMRAPALLFCGMPTGEEILWVAAARKLKIPIVGVQHGAHYGFTNQACFVETEFAYCDYFMSWGWSAFPETPLSKDIQAVPLPSPWLSERVNKWHNLCSLRVGERLDRPHDVLLMSDRVQPFPPTVSTLRMSRLDFLNRLNSTIQEMVDEFARRHIRVLNKPFNYTSRDIQSAVLDRLTTEFPDFYSEYKTLDKGLTEELLRSAWLVLWDEPGTGFFECLSSGIPTMVHWERLTSREEKHARPYFRRLESVGLLHNNVSSMAEEIQKFLDDPEPWLVDEERSSVIKDVCNQFSKTDQNWDKSFTGALEKIAT